MELSFHFSERAKDLHQRVLAFAQSEVAPAEPVFGEQVAAGDRWKLVPIMEELKKKARAQGLWNLFLPDSERGAGLTNVEYAPICEIMGYYPLLSEAMNCSAPDTGNMEMLERFGTRGAEGRGCEPLLAGEIRSAFCMTEPDVASSDATNIASRIERDGDHYVDQRPQVVVVGRRRSALQGLHRHGQDRPAGAAARQQSMIVVPRDTPGVTVERVADGVRLRRRAARPRRDRCSKTCACPATNILLGEGRGFEIAQGRLGPGRIHHCMRSIGIGRARARADVQARAEARRVRQTLAEHGQHPSGHRASRASRSTRPGCSRCMPRT